MTTETVLEGNATANVIDHLDERPSAYTATAYQYFATEKLDTYDLDMSLVQTMGLVVSWFSCMLVVLALVGGGYVALSDWPSNGTSRRPPVIAQPISSARSDFAALHALNHPVPRTSEQPQPMPLEKLTVGAVFRDLTIAGEECLHCPEMTVVPHGSFTLGAGSGEPWREEWQTASEAPTVKITLHQPFAVGRYAVTFDQWEACVAGGGCAASPNDNGWGRADRPVINVSWRDASQYVSWLSAKTGKPYRLLSEAEREYVTRAGTTTAFWFGEEPSPKYANYLWDRTMPVDSLKANAWGLFHVHGNVSEWMADCWNNSHRGHSGSAAARMSGDCKRRVVKGGAWFNSPNLLRSAARAGLNGAARYQTVGLRVARTIVDGR